MHDIKQEVHDKNNIRNKKKELTMKKTKLFMPLLGLAISTYAVASMVVLSNCSKKATTNEVLNIWKDPNGLIVFRWI